MPGDTCIFQTNKEKREGINPAFFSTYQISYQVRVVQFFGITQQFTEPQSWMSLRNSD